MNDNKELLSQLEKIDQLLRKNSDLQDYAKEGVVIETMERIDAIRKARGNPPAAPTVFQTMPIFPLDDENLRTLEQKYKSTKKILFILLGITAFFMIMTFVFDVLFFTTPTTISILASIVYALYYNLGIKSSYVSEKKNYDESISVFNKTMAAFREGLPSFEQEKKDGHQAIKDFGAIHRKAFEDYCQAIEDFETNKTKAEAEIENNTEEIRNMDVIPEEYYYCVDRMIPLLRSGRADNYKEALNMAIEQERQEREEYTRRLEEEQRQREEARRIAIMEAQAEEQRRHNQEIEHQQAMQAEQARHAANQAEKAQRDAERAALDRCRRCAYNTKCSYDVQKRSINCGSYRPR